MKKSYIKIISYLLLITLASGSLSGCEKVISAFKKEKIQISIGDWVKDSEYETELKERFEEKYPYIEIIPETYVFSVGNFKEKAESGTLPNLYRAYFTEIKGVIDNGYAIDLTEYLNKAGWSQYMNPELKELLSDDDGRIYGIPYEVYAQGLYINKKLFRDAGLVDEAGEVIYPKSLEEMAEYAKLIREKTGKAGFVMPTTKNNGGWNFLSIAWNFGTNFLEEQEDGSYRAVFDTPETVAALQYVKDLQWKYNALPRRRDIDNEMHNQLFSIGEAAMMFSPPTSYAFEKYGVSRDDIMVVGIPEGPGGSYSQMGGTAYMISAGTSPEQIDAILKWIEFIGKGPEITDEQIGILEGKLQRSRDSGGSIMARETFDIWLDEVSNAKKQELRTKYCNVDAKNYEDYYRFSGIQIRPEEKAHCQDLYSVLDKCVQAVINDENANPEELIKNANKEFQEKFLD